MLIHKILQRLMETPIRIIYKIRVYIPLKFVNIKKQKIGSCCSTHTKKSIHPTEWKNVKWVACETKKRNKIKLK